MKCVKCNKELSGFEKKCPECGTVIERKEGELELTGYLNRITDKKEDDPSVRDIALQKEIEAPLQNNKTKAPFRSDKTKRWFFGGLAVLILMVIGIFAWKESKKEFLGTDSFIYKKENGVYQFLPKKDKSEMLSEGNFGSDSTMSTLFEHQYTEDEKKMVFYGENGATTEARKLYYKENYLESNPVLIADNVTEFQLAGNEGIIYRTIYSELYYYDYKHNWLLGEEVQDFSVNRTGSHVIYYTYDGLSGERIGYLMNVNEIETKYVLGQCERIIGFNDDFSKLVYVVNGVLYLLDDYSQRTTIATDVEQFYVQFKGEDAWIYYVTDYGKELRAYDFVDDIYYEQDRLITKKPLESEENYEEHRKAYEDKMTRDAIREQLRAYSFGGLAQTLLVYKDGKTEAISNTASELYSMNFYLNGMDLEEMEQDLPCFYTEKGETQIPEIVFDGKQSGSQIISMIEEAIYEAENTIYLYDCGYQLEIGKVDRYDLDTTAGVVYTEELQENEAGETRYGIKIMNYKPGKIGNYSTLIDDENDIFLEAVIGDVALYYTRVQYGTKVKALLYKEGERLTEVEGYVRYSLTKAEKDSSYFYLKSEGGKTNLYGMQEDGTEKLIATEIYSFYPVSENEVYILMDYDDMKQSGDLYYYSGTEVLAEIDKNVYDLNGQTWLQYID